MDGDIYQPENSKTSAFLSATTPTGTPTQTTFGGLAWTKAMSQTRMFSALANSDEQS